MKDFQSDILNFWFVETAPAQWFQKNPEFDDVISARFFRIYEWARDGLCDGWMRDVDGCLALCVLLDQFPRNMFRDAGDAFKTDEKALYVARHAISKGYDQILNPQKRRFLYLPFEHSESLEHQNRSLILFQSLRDADPIVYDYAVRHHKVIAAFGRFPHRNAALGRTSTPAEIKFLKEPSSRF